MYSGGDNEHKRFLRHEANGQSFEFSDGRFTINARMDGNTYKPILHLSITPINDNELGNFFAMIYLLLQENILRAHKVKRVLIFT